VHNLFAIVCVAFDHGAPPEKLATFKKCFFSCPVVDSAMEVTSSYDLIVRGHCASVEEYHRSFGTLRPPIAELVARFETNSVSLEVLRDASATSELWEELGRVDFCPAASIDARESELQSRGLFTLSVVGTPVFTMKRQLR
jgi:DNA-binding Lrp family transcriptional regulator